MSSENALASVATIFQRQKCFDLLEYARTNREDGIFNDVTIQAGSFTIGANRMVLSCHSTFFEKMFRSKMKERYEPTVEIKQIDATAVKLLVDYIYNGNITVDSANVMDLLVAADFLQLAEVKQFCLKILQQHICSDNWYAVLTAAKLYSSDQLQQHVYQFITDHLEEAIKSTDFKNIKRDDLTTIISTLRKSKKAIDETVICKLVIDWIKQDEKVRKQIFADLIKEVNFQKVSYEDLQMLLVEEVLVKNNLVCSNAVLNVFFSLLKENQCKETCSDATKIICIGGTKTGNKVVEIFNILDVTEQNFPDLPYSIDYHCALTLDDMIFCIGGRNPVDNIDIYNKVCQIKLNEKSLKWREVDAMNEKRCSMGAAVFRDYLVVAGGWNGQVYLASTEYFSTFLNKWQMAPTMQQKRHGNALVVCKDNLFALGGYDGKDYLASVERLRSLNDNWEFVAPMLAPRFSMAVVSLNGCIYAIGGRSEHSRGTMQNTVEKYDPCLNKWTKVSKMNYKRTCHFAGVLNGKIFVIGGIDVSGNVVKDVEVYFPKKDEWIVPKSPQHQKHLFCYAAAVII